MANGRITAPTEDNLMAQNVPSPSKGPAPPAAERAPAAPRAQAPPAPVVARTPSARRTRPEEPQRADSDDFEPPRVSHVRILPTSLPYVHDQLMEQRDREQRARDEELRQKAAGNEADSTSEHKELSQEEQVLTARALKPHSRSVVDLDKLRLEPPIGQPITQQPKKSRKWQFGIRSRNQPYEAMLYLYRAIAAQGGVWDIQPVESGMIVVRPPMIHTDPFQGQTSDPIQHPRPTNPSRCRVNTPTFPQTTTSRKTLGSFALVF